ncbi:MAG: hypothetical protein FWC39_00830 [Bacteroidetes bacterium]|nr:hypothetical protein [Bacteroidota bacterium]
MKRFLNIIIIGAIVFSMASCAMHSGLTSNMNNNNTKVVLQNNNYTIISKVKGSASGVAILGFGGSFKPLVENARSKMLESADLVGKSRAVINQTVEENDKFFVVCRIKTVTVSAYVVEFTGATSVAKTNNTNTEKPANQTTVPSYSNNAVAENESFDVDIDFEFDNDVAYTANTGFNKATAPSNNTITNNTATNSQEIAERPADTKAIAGRWSRENDGLVVTISGNVGVLTQVTSGFWLRLLNEGRVSIGSQMFRNFTKIDNTTWQVQELVVGPTTSNWRTTTMTLNGNTLTIGNPQSGFVLMR